MRHNAWSSDLVDMLLPGSPTYRKRAQLEVQGRYIDIRLWRLSNE